MTPAEALRRARVTMECGGWIDVECPIGESYEFEMAWLTVLNALSLEDSHPLAASALLDGYSVREINKAGG